jgi:hypothetical protein
MPKMPWSSLNFTLVKLKYINADSHTVKKNAIFKREWVQSLA